MELKIQDAIDKVMGYFKEIPLSSYSITAYQNCYKSMSAFLSSSITLLSCREIAAYMEKQNALWGDGKISKKRYKYSRRAAKILLVYLQNGELTWKHYSYENSKLHEKFNSILTNFSANLLSQAYARGSIQVIMSSVKQFLNYVEDCGVYDTNELTDEHVKRFLITSAPRNSGNMANLIWSLKKFISFINISGFTALNTDRSLQKPKPRLKKLLPCFTEHEVNAILGEADMSAAIGKRDYAIIKLAVELGLRGYDILAMKLTDIDWRNNEISIFQSKTKKNVQLPLLPDVGNAIMDYILDARPKSDSPYIFLRCQKPYTKLGRHGHGKQIMDRLLPKAGIQHDAWDGKTFHAFRRTRGTSLVRAGVPLTMVSQVLGQTDIDSAKQYVSLNDEMLRICCLDITKYSTGKGGLA